MAADLKGNAIGGGCSLFLRGDHLLKLDHDRTRDRMRRFRYASIEQIITWQRVPLFRVLVVVLLFGVPAAMVYVNSFRIDEGEIAFIVTLMVVGGLLVMRYVLWRSTTIRIVAGGKSRDIVGIFRPRKLKRFQQSLSQHIRNAQMTVQPPALPQDDIATERLVSERDE